MKRKFESKSLQVVSAAEFSVAIYNGKFPTDLLLFNLQLCVTFYNIFPKYNFFNVFFFFTFSIGIFFPS